MAKFTTAEVPSDISLWESVPITKSDGTGYSEIRSVGGWAIAKSTSGTYTVMTRIGGQNIPVQNGFKTAEDGIGFIHDMRAGFKKADTDGPKGVVESPGSEDLSPGSEKSKQMGTPEGDGAPKETEEPVTQVSPKNLVDTYNNKNNRKLHINNLKIFGRNTPQDHYPPVKPTKTTDPQTGSQIIVNPDGTKSLGEPNPEYTAPEYADETDVHGRRTEEWNAADDLRHDIQSQGNVEFKDFESVCRANGYTDALDKLDDLADELGISSEELYNNLRKSSGYESSEDRPGQPWSEVDQNLKDKFLLLGAYNQDKLGHMTGYPVRPAEHTQRALISPWVTFDEDMYTQGKSMGNKEAAIGDTAMKVSPASRERKDNETGKPIPQHRPGDLSSAASEEFYTIVDALSSEMVHDSMMDFEDNARSGKYPQHQTEMNIYLGEREDVVRNISVLNKRIKHLEVTENANKKIGFNNLAFSRFGLRHRAGTPEYDIMHKLIIAMNKDHASEMNIYSAKPIADLKDQRDRALIRFEKLYPTEKSRLTYEAISDRKAIEGLDKELQSLYASSGMKEGDATFTPNRYVNAAFSEILSKYDSDQVNFALDTYQKLLNKDQDLVNARNDRVNTSEELRDLYQIKEEMYTKLRDLDKSMEDLDVGHPLTKNEATDKVLSVLGGASEMGVDADTYIQRLKETGDLEGAKICEKFQTMYTNRTEKEKEFPQEGYTKPHPLPMQTTRPLSLVAFVFKNKIWNHIDPDTLKYNSIVDKDLFSAITPRSKWGIAKDIKRWVISHGSGNDERTRIKTGTEEINRLFRYRKKLTSAVYDILSYNFYSPHWFPTSITPSEPESEEQKIARRKDYVYLIREINAMGRTHCLPKLTDDLDRDLAIISKWIEVHKGYLPAYANNLEDPIDFSLRMALWRVEFERAYQRAYAVSAKASSGFTRHFTTLSTVPRFYRHIPDIPGDEKEHKYNKYNFSTMWEIFAQLNGWMELDEKTGKYKVISPRKNIYGNLIKSYPKERDQSAKYTVWDPRNHMLTFGNVFADRNKVDREKEKRRDASRRMDQSRYDKSLNERYRLRNTALDQVFADYERNKDDYFMQQDTDPVTKEKLFNEDGTPKMIPVHKDLRHKLLDTVYSGNASQSEDNYRNMIARWDPEGLQKMQRVFNKLNFAKNWNPEAVDVGVKGLGSKGATGLDQRIDPMESTYTYRDLVNDVRDVLEYADMSTNMNDGSIYDMGMIAREYANLSDEDLMDRLKKDAIDEIAADNAYREDRIRRSKEIQEDEKPLDPEQRSVDRTKKPKSLLRQLLSKAQERRFRQIAEKYGIADEFEELVHNSRHTQSEEALEQNRDAADIEEEEYQNAMSQAKYDYVNEKGGFRYMKDTMSALGVLLDEFRKKPKGLQKIIESPEGMTLLAAITNGHYKGGSNGGKVHINIKGQEMDVDIPSYNKLKEWIYDTDYNKTHPPDTYSKRAMIFAILDALTKGNEAIDPHYIEANRHTLDSAIKTIMNKGYETFVNGFTSNRPDLTREEYAQQLDNIADQNKTLHEGDGEFKPQTDWKDVSNKLKAGEIKSPESMDYGNIPADQAERYRKVGLNGAEAQAAFKAGFLPGVLESNEPTTTPMSLDKDPVPLKGKEMYRTDPATKPKEKDNPLYWSVPKEEEAHQMAQFLSGFLTRKGGLDELGDLVKRYNVESAAEGSNIESSHIDTTSSNVILDSIKDLAKGINHALILSHAVRWSHSNGKPYIKILGLSPPQKVAEPDGSVIEDEGWIARQMDYEHDLEERNKGIQNTLGYLENTMAGVPKYKTEGRTPEMYLMPLFDPDEVASSILNPRASRVDANGDLKHSQLLLIQLAMYARLFQYDPQIMSDKGGYKAIANGKYISWNSSGRVPQQIMDDLIKESRTGKDSTYNKVSPDEIAEMDRLDNLSKVGALRNQEISKLTKEIEAAMQDTPDNLEEIDQIRSEAQKERESKADAEGTSTPTGDKKKAVTNAMRHKRDAEFTDVKADAAEKEEDAAPDASHPSLPEGYEGPYFIDTDGKYVPCKEKDLPKYKKMGLVTGFAGREGSATAQTGAQNENNGPEVDQEYGIPKDYRGRIIYDSSNRRWRTLSDKEFEDLKYTTDEKGHKRQNLGQYSILNYPRGKPDPRYPGVHKDFSGFIAKDPESGKYMEIHNEYEMGRVKGNGWPLISYPPRSAVRKSTQTEGKNMVDDGVIMKAVEDDESCEEIKIPAKDSSEEDEGEEKDTSFKSLYKAKKDENMKERGYPTVGGHDFGDCVPIQNGYRQNFMGEGKQSVTPIKPARKKTNADGCSKKRVNL